MNSPERPTKPYFKHLLSFEGGGIRGVSSATYLKRLCEADPKTGKPSINLDSLHSVSGTSTGSIVAAALCRRNPYSPGEIVDLFSELSKVVFKRSSWKPQWLERIWSFAPFDIKKLEDVLRSNLGENMLVGDCVRRFVCVTYRLNGEFRGYPASVPMIIHSHGGLFPSENRFLSMPLYKAVTSSCTAPSYFKPYEWEHEGEKFICVDGGICSNSSVLPNYSICRNKYIGEKISRKEISALVIGNGTHYSHETIHSLSGWRTPRMVKVLVDSLVQSNVIFEHKIAKKISDERVYTLDIQPDKNVDLADYSQIEYLKEFSESQDLSRVRAWLRGYFI